jgi:hypothetical protein
MEVLKDKEVSLLAAGPEGLSVEACESKEVREGAPGGTYTLSITADWQEIAWTKGTGVYTGAQNVVVGASPESGYYFSHWETPTDQSLDSGVSLQEFMIRLSASSSGSATYKARGQRLLQVADMTTVMSTYNEPRLVCSYSVTPALGYRA